MWPSLQFLSSGSEFLLILIIRGEAVNSASPPALYKLTVSMHKRFPEQERSVVYFKWNRGAGHSEVGAAAVPSCLLDNLLLLHLERGPIDWKGDRYSEPVLGSSRGWGPGVWAPLIPIHLWLPDKKYHLKNEMLPTIIVPKKHVR